MHLYTLHICIAFTFYYNFMTINVTLHLLGGGGEGGTGMTDLTMDLCIEEE
jgi:hypothetical protein